MWGSNTTKQKLAECQKSSLWTNVGTQFFERLDSVIQKIPSYTGEAFYPIFALQPPLSFLVFSSTPLVGQCTQCTDEAITNHYTNIYHPSRTSFRIQKAEPNTAREGGFFLFLQFCPSPLLAESFLRLRRRDVISIAVLFRLISEQTPELAYTRLFFIFFIFYFFVWLLGRFIVSVVWFLYL